MLSMVVTLLVSKLDKSRLVRDEQSPNIFVMFSAALLSELLVFTFVKLTDVSDEQA